MNALLFAMTDGFDLIVQPTAQIHFKDKFYFHTGGRNLNGFHFGAGFTLWKHIHLGYNYELNWSQLSNDLKFHRHEFFLNYAIIRPTKKPKFTNTGTPAF